MKRQIFFAVAIAGLTVAANAQSIFDDDANMFIDSIAVEHPILTKVFPGVVFAAIADRTVLPPGRHIFAYFAGKRLSGGFNEIYAGVADIAKASIKDRIEAFVRLHYWLRDSSATIDRPEKIQVDMEGTRYDYKLKAIVRNVVPDSSAELEILIQIRKDQISRMEVYKNGHRIGVDKLKIVGFMDENATIEVGGTFGWAIRPA